MLPIEVLAVGGTHCLHLWSSRNGDLERKEAG